MSDGTQPTNPPPRIRRHPQGACTNCGSQIEYPLLYKGVVVCKDCLRLTNHLLDNARKYFQKAFETYSEVLRAAILKHQLNLPVTDGSKPDENETGSEVHDTMQALRGNDQGGHGEVPGGG